MQNFHDTTTLDTYLPVEVDADVSPHVLWTDGQDLEDGETQKSPLGKKLTTVTEDTYHPPPRAQVSLRGFNPVEKCTNCLMEARRCIRSTSSVLFVRLFLASVILHIFRRVRVSYSAAGPVTEHIAVLDGSVGSWTKNTNSQLAGYSKTKHNYFKNRQG